jgi:hypothetical protein
MSQKKELYTAADRVMSKHDNRLGTVTTNMPNMPTLLITWDSGSPATSHEADRWLIPVISGRVTER